MPEVLLAYQTTMKTTTKKTPFVLTYRSEAIILIEIGVPNYRVQHFNEKTNEEAMYMNLDMVEELRDMVVMRAVIAKWKMEQYCNKRVKHRVFKLEDLVRKETGVNSQE